MPTTVEVRRGSLTDGNETVLVNASNTEVALGYGVSAAIRSACGPGYQDAIQEQLESVHGGSMEPGDVLVTDAGTHPRARFVAHVAVMDYRPGAGRIAQNPTRERIERACEHLWDEIERLPGDEPHSVAMVALGAGVGGLGVRAPTEIACTTLAAHLARTAATRIAHVAFYAWSLPDHININEAVLAQFPDARVTDPATQQLAT